MADKYIVPDTLCGKCGKRVLEPGEPAGLLGSPVCDCADIVPASQALPEVETHPIIGNMPAYRAAMSSSIRGARAGRQKQVVPNVPKDWGHIWLREVQRWGYPCKLVRA